MIHILSYIIYYRCIYIYIMYIYIRYITVLDVWVNETGKYLQHFAILIGNMLKTHGLWGI